MSDLIVSEEEFEFLALNPVVASTRSPAVTYVAGLDSPNSKRVMTGALRKVAGLLNSEINRLDWSTLRYDHAVLIRDKLLEHGLSAHSVNLCITAIRGVARESWRLGLLSHEELCRIQEVKHVKISRRPKGKMVSAERLQEMTAWIRKPRDRAIWFLLLCGLRRSEVCSLQFCDLDAGKLTVIGKGNKERLVPLPAKALGAVNAWIEKRGDADGPLFPGRSRNGSISPNTVYALVKSLGASEFSPHDLRRTFITRLLDERDSATVAHLAGHESVDTTRRYDHRADDRAAEAMASFEIV